MASSSCWKCLLRPSAPSASSSLRSVATRSQFSTSEALNSTAKEKMKSSLLTPAKKKAPPKLKLNQHRGGKTLKIKKKAPVKSGRPPAPGERKAFRKRIILSNANALEVEGLEELSSEAMMNPELVGQVVSIPDAVIDQLRAVEAFKTTQGWKLFRKPGTLIRGESIEVAKLLLDAEKEKKTFATIIDGNRNTGKSLMLLQAMATAFTKGWIVVNIPEAQELATAVTDYSPIPGTTPTQYSQNVYIAKLLAQVGKANAQVLSKLEVTQKHVLPIPLQENISLARLAELGARDPEVAFPIFKAFWAEITATGRPPVLFTLDGLSYIMNQSAYRDADFNPIHSHDLALVGQFVDYLSGKKTLPNGGVVLASTSKAHAPVSVSMSLALSQTFARQSKTELPKPDPFTTYDSRALAALKRAQLMTLKGLTKEEAKGLMSYWAASGVLRQTVDEKTVSEQWSLAGSGVVGELQRGLLNMRI